MDLARHPTRWALTSLLRRIVGERGYLALQLRWLAFSLRSGRGAEPEAALLPAVVAAGDTVVDVGANLGFYTYRLARLVGNEGRVVAIEPIPLTRAMLTWLLRRLGVTDVVEVLGVGVSDEAGTASFVVYARPDGSLYSGRSWSLHPSREDAAPGGIRVEMQRLDDLVHGEVAFMKLDIEGAELFALRGAQRLLTESAPTLLLENAGNVLARQGVDRAEIRDLLDSFDYETFVFRQQRLVPALATAVNGNLIAVHPRRRHRVSGLVV